MKVIRAAKAGFCFGVKRAIDLTKRTAETSETASLGPLIHNQQVVERLAKQGINVVNSVEEANSTQTMIIRSHGVAPHVYAELTERDVTVVDATCPFVQKAQHLAAESAANGQVIVIGDKQHPEVRGILGWAGERAIAIEKIQEARDLAFYSSLAVLAQTTQKEDDFLEIVEELRKHTEKLTVHNTICNATHERQDVAKELAEQVEVMIVVGGQNSANTRKLAAICAEKTPTYLIETAAELQKIWFVGAHTAGLTAGASTPDWIIEEVYNKMSEINEVEPNVDSQEPEDFDMSSWDKSFQKIYRGAIVTGTVVKMTSDEVFVDIGWKSEGIIELKELSISPVTNPAEVVSVGDRISALVIQVSNEEGYAVLSKRRAGETDAIDRLAEFAESKEEIKAIVTEVVKGGLLVDVGMRGFVPASQVQLGYIEDLNVFLGQTLRLRVLEFDPSKRKVVLSQKVILAEEQLVKRTQLLETLKEGDVVKGVVRRLASFGAFVDIGGVDGLLHISDISYSRIAHPSVLINIGDEIEVKVLKIEAETGKISLGFKQLKPSPWSLVEEKYPVGSLVNGKVVRITPFGAFVQLEDGVDALVHISQLANRRIVKVEEVVKVGDMVSAKVIECKPVEKRISLSIREAVEEAVAVVDAEAMAQQPETPEMTIGDAVRNA